MARSNISVCSTLRVCLLLFCAVLLSLQSGARAESRWALLIGVNDYQKAAKLDTAMQDAVAVGKQLVSLGYPQNQVFLMTTGSRETEADYPSRKNVLARLDDLAGRIKPGDTLLVYFSGHGFGRNGAQHLLLADADPDNLLPTTVALTEIRTKVAATSAKQAFFFLDAGRDHPAENVAVQERSPLQPPAATRRMPEPPGRAELEYVVFSACKDGETASDDSQLGHGVFTYYLLEGLRGKARNPKGQITVKSLTDYVTDQMEAWSKTHPAQTPWLVLNGPASSLVLTDAAPADTLYLDTLTPPQQTPAGSYHPARIRLTKDRPPVAHCVVVGSSVVFDLNGDYKTFAARFGMAALNGALPDAHLRSEVECVVLLDDQAVTTFHLNAAETEFKLRRVPIEGKRKLELRVNAAGKALPPDYVCWLGEACFTNEDNPPPPHPIHDDHNSARLEATVTIHLLPASDSPLQDLRILGWQALVDGKVQVPIQSAYHTAATLHVEKGREHKIVVRWHGGGYMTENGTRFPTYRYRDISVRFTLPVEDDAMSIVVRPRVKNDLFNAHLEVKVLNDNDLDKNDRPKEIRSSWD